MNKDSILIIVLMLLITSMFTFGSRLGMKIQSALAGPIVSQEKSDSLETISQTVTGYGASHTIGIATTTTNGKTVPVYSRYPFNFKNELLIAAGEGQGIEVGDVALYQGSVLGSVEKVFKDSALVETIFDSRFKTPVRIGSRAADSLLIGGPEPQLTLIERSASVGENDAVYAAGEGWPYGIALGSLKDIKNNGDNIYRSATLRVFYNPASLQSVTIVPKSS